MEKIELGKGWWIRAAQNPEGDEGYNLYSPDGWERWDNDLSRLVQTAEGWM